VEVQFMVRDVTSNLDRYYLVLATLSEFQVAKVLAVTEEEPNDKSYSRIKAALLATHTLTPFQQVDKLVNMEGLGGRKPSELLAELDKFKPRDMHSFYAYHFLQRMPREVRVLLAREDASNMGLLAEKADELMSLHLPQQHDMVAAVQQESTAGEEAAEAESVAAVSGKTHNKKGGCNKKKDRKKQGGRSSSTSIVDQSPLCWAHIKYGDKAYNCMKPCAWPEN
jgi:hypothetical protein